MEVSDNISNARGVMVVEIDRTVFLFFWDLWLILGAEGKPPKYGTGGFTSPSEEDGVLYNIYSDRHFIKNNMVVVFI